jgi:hypothetical protein
MAMTLPLRRTGIGLVGDIPWIVAEPLTPSEGIKALRLAVRMIAL